MPVQLPQNYTALIDLSTASSPVDGDVLDLWAGGMVHVPMTICGARGPNLTGTGQVDAIVQVCATEDFTTGRVVNLDFSSTTNTNGLIQVTDMAADMYGSAMQFCRLRFQWTGFTGGIEEVHLVAIPFGRVR